MQQPLQAKERNDTAHGAKGAVLPQYGEDMGIILDLIFLCIAVAAIVVAAKKGIVKTVLDIVAFVLAVVLSAQLATPFAEGVYDAFLGESLQNRVEEALPEDSGSADVGVILEGLPDFVTDYLESTGFNADALSQHLAGGANAAEAAQQITDEVVRPVCIAALGAILFLLLCIVLLAVFKIVADWVSKLFKIPIVKTLNQGLGAVLGAVKGLLIVVIVSLLLLVVAPHIGGGFESMVSDSYIVEQVERFLPESLSEILL